MDIAARQLRVLAVRKRNLIWSQCRAEDKFLRFFALRMTVGPKIPGAVIPRRVFTQPGSIATSAAGLACRFMSASIRKRPPPALPRNDALGHEPTQTTQESFKLSLVGFCTRNDDNFLGEKDGILT